MTEDVWHPEVVKVTLLIQRHVRRRREHLRGDRRGPDRKVLQGVGGSGPWGGWTRVKVREDVRVGCNVAVQKVCYFEEVSFRGELTAMQTKSYSCSHTCRVRGSIDHFVD